MDGDNYAHFIKTISYEETYFYIVLELDCFGNKPLKRKKKIIV